MRNDFAQIVKDEAEFSQENKIDRRNKSNKNPG